MAINVFSRMFVNYPISMFDKNKENNFIQDKTRQDKTRQLYFTRVAQSAARLVSLGALGNTLKNNFQVSLWHLTIIKES